MSRTRPDDVIKISAHREVCILDDNTFDTTGSSAELLSFMSVGYSRTTIFVKNIHGTDELTIDVEVAPYNSDGSEPTTQQWRKINTVDYPKALAAGESDIINLIGVYGYIRVLGHDSSGGGGNNDHARIGVIMTRDG